MKHFCVTALLAMVSAVCSADTAPAEVQTVDTMTMRQDSRCQQVLVNCVINGVPMRMMLDTGATNTVLHSGSISKLKNPQLLDTSHMQLRGNAKERPSVYLVKMQLAQYAIPQIPVLALNLDGARTVMDEKIDGIIGMDLLGSMPFTFDVASGKLHWGLPEGDVKLVPLAGSREESGRMHVQIECDGRPMEILLDSGASITRLPASAWPAGAAGKVNLKVSDVNSAEALAATVAAPGVVKLAPGVELKDVRPVFCSEEERAILGMDIISRVRLVHVPSASMPGGYFFLAL